MPFGSALREFRKTGAAASRRAPGSVDLQHVLPSDLLACGDGLEAAAAGAPTREDAAGRMVAHLFGAMRLGETGEPGCALVRCFQTHPLRALPPERKTFALRQLGDARGVASSRDDVRCLALLATRGTEPQWNRVEDSAGHQAIPLPSVEVILRAPMIARLLLQMGVRYEHVVAPPEGDDLLLESHGGALNVFHVGRARGSQYIPAQSSFVQRYGIRSVLGFGALSPAGELFATVLFTRVQVTRDTAAQFAPLAAVARTVFLRYTPEQTFTA